VHGGIGHCRLAIYMVLIFPINLCLAFLFCNVYGPSIEERVGLFDGGSEMLIV
jgi:hypothetical protein